jgi:hypothetical protein
MLVIAMLGGSRANALEDLGNISQIEGIERFVRGRSQLSLDSVVHIEHGIYNQSSVVSDGVSKSPQEEFYNGVEDVFNGVLIQLSVGQQVEVSNDSVGDEGSTTTWGTHSSNDDQILDFHEFELLSVIPSKVIKVLSKDLHRGLSTILFLLGHVEIIDKENALLASRRAIDTLSPLLKLSIDGILGLVGGCLSREGDVNTLILLRKPSLEKGVAIEGFTSTDRARAHDVLLVGDQSLHEVEHSGVIIGGDDDVTETVALIDLEVLVELAPRLEFVLLLIIVEVVHLPIFREFDGSSLQVHEFSQLLIK